MKLIRIGYLLIAAALSSAPLAFGQEAVDSLRQSPETVPLTPEQDLLYKDIAKNLRCPTCVGISVLDSKEGFSERIKHAVRQQLAEGKSGDEITEFFTQRYGPWILRSPPTEGFDLVAWLIPILLLGLGPVVIWLTVWRSRQEIDTQGIRPTKDILAEMEANLRRMREEKGEI
jgi:cytochrome c-type biogenesis protein CcmH/NrfF